MPGWVPASERLRIAERLGVSTSDPDYGRALAAAEARVEELTGLILGRSEDRDLIADLDAPMLAIELPRDTTVVAGVEPDPGDIELAGALLYRRENGRRVAWDPDTYVVHLTRGLDPVPADIIEAVALLTAALLEPPDPDRSRFSAGGPGAPGTPRASLTGIPEADQLLARWLPGPSLEAL